MQNVTKKSADPKPYVTGSNPRSLRNSDSGRKKLVGISAIDSGQDSSSLGSSSAQWCCYSAHAHVFIVSAA